MKYKLKIHCTKEHLKQSLMCGTNNNDNEVPSNCWIAKAVQSVFPKAEINYKCLLPIGDIHYENNLKIRLPEEAINAYVKFDKLAKYPEKRLKLEPFSFEVEFNQETFEKILECNGFSCQQFKDKVLSSGNLELIEN